jgi:hypothetical protein
MKKKTLIGSIFVLTLLLLMPSIPAIHQKMVKDEMLSEISDDLDLKKITEFKALMKIKYPILNKLVNAHIMFLMYRTGLMISIHLALNQKGIIGELAYYRFQILLYRTVCYYLICMILSDELGWNWELPF